MPKFFIENNQIYDKQYINIKGQDVNHIKKVLRKNINDEIIICNKENKQDYICKIKEINEEIKCEIIKEIEQNAEPKTEVSIFQGIPKSDKMELIIQKSVELGVYDITPIEMKRCVVKLKENDKRKKIERWQKISEGAAKQAGRNYIPAIEDIKNVKQVCEEFVKYDLVLIAYECEEENTIKNELIKIKEATSNNLKIAIIIGPEGGIDEQEINLFKQSGANIVTLGKRILRTETVALNVLSIIMYELED